MGEFSRLALSILAIGVLGAGCATGQSDTSLETPTESACTITPNAAELSAALDAWFGERGELHAFDALIVEQCGTRLYEVSFAGFELDDAHEIQSATKTLSAIAIGAALENELIESVDQPISSLLPEYISLLTGKKQDITLRQVLSMRTGLAWQDFGLGNSFRRIEGAGDSAQFTLSEPLVSEPGESFFYNTGSSQLLSVIVEAVSGKSTQDFLQEGVLDAIGVSTLEWRTTRDGISKGGWDAFLSPNDMAKIGQLLLDGGIGSDGARLLTAEFVSEMLTPHSENAFDEHGYGFQTWIVNGYGTDVAGARGYGQQNIFVLRDLNAVVVTTANIFYPAENSQMVDELMTEIIVPALKAAD